MGYHGAFTSKWEGHDCGAAGSDRKSTRLNSSHLVISYAVFCLKKKKIWNFPLIADSQPAPPASGNSCPTRRRPPITPPLLPAALHPLALLTMISSPVSSPNRHR